jgi:glycosyltransferase involved in cell wall biosynthesis
MLARAVRSVLRQDLGDFELLVVDDGSTPSHAATIDAMGALADPRARVLRNATSLGAAAARNAGIDAARGRYVAFLDDDDEYLPTFLRATQERLESALPEVAIALSNVRFIEEPESPGAHAHVSETAFASHAPLESSFRTLLAAGTGFGLTVRTEALRAIGGFNAELRAVEDTDLFFRLLARGFVPAVLHGVHVVVHEHRGPRLTSRARDAIRIRECHWLLREHAVFMDRYPSTRRDLARGLASLEAASARACSEQA